MLFLTDQMIADAMNELPTLFDAHALEKRCLRRNPVETADEIKRQHATGDPLLYFSAVFSRYVATAFRGQIAKTSKVDSDNLGGDTSKNQQWRKLVTRVLAPTAPPAPPATVPTPATLPGAELPEPHGAAMPGPG